MSALWRLSIGENGRLLLPEQVLEWLGCEALVLAPVGSAWWGWPFSRYEEKVGGPIRRGIASGETASLEALVVVSEARSLSPINGAIDFAALAGRKVVLHKVLDRIEIMYEEIWREREARSIERAQSGKCLTVPLRSITEPATGDFEECFRHLRSWIRSNFLSERVRSNRPSRRFPGQRGKRRVVPKLAVFLDPMADITYVDLLPLARVLSRISNAEVILLRLDEMKGLHLDRSGTTTTILRRWGLARQGSHCVPIEVHRVLQWVGRKDYKGCVVVGDASTIGRFDLNHHPRRLKIAWLLYGEGPTPPFGKLFVCPSHQ